MSQIGAHFHHQPPTTHPPSTHHPPTHYAFGVVVSEFGLQASISDTGESNLPSSSGEAGASDPHPAGQTPAFDAQTPAEEVAQMSTRTIMSRETERKLLRDVVKAQLRDRLGKDNEADSRKIYTTLYSAATPAPFWDHFSQISRLPTAAHACAVCLGYSVRYLKRLMLIGACDSML